MKFFLLCMIFSTNLFSRELEIKMKSMSYEPKSIVLAVGDSVKWKNMAYTDHSATGTGFDTGLVPSKGESKVIVFSKAGTFTYHCQVHGKAMTGTIIVGAK